MASSSCKRTSHHGDHHGKQNQQHHHHHHHQHDRDHDHDHDDDHDVAHYDDNQQHSTNNSGNNRFTTFNRRLMQLHFNNSSLTLAAAVFIFVAVLLIPHNQVFAEETVSEINYTTEIVVQPSTPNKEPQIYNEQTVEGENNEAPPPPPPPTTIDQQMDTINQLENLNEDVVEYQSNIDVATVDIIANNDNNDNNDNNVKQPQTDTAEPHTHKNVELSNTNIETAKNTESLLVETTTISTTIIRNEQILKNDLLQTSVDNSISLQTVNNDSNSPQIASITNVADTSSMTLTNNDDLSGLVHSQTIETDNNDKQTPLVGAEDLTPPIVEEPSSIDDEQQQEQQQQQQHQHHLEVNNDIFSTIVDVHTEIKTSPDFIDSQPGGKVPEPTENLEQSIRQSVKTEIEMEQNLESSPVLEILKDIAEPEIRQTLTEDLIEPSVLNLKEFTSKREEEDDSVKTKQTEEIEPKEDQSEGHETLPSKDINGEPENMDLSNWVYLRGARNLAIETANVTAQLNGSSSSSSSASSASSSSSSSSASLSSSTSSESNSKENDSTISHNKSKSKEDEKETKTKTADEIKEIAQKLEATDDDVDNEEKNNAQEEFDTEESKADLNIPETSQELRGTVTTPTPSDIAILDDAEAENVAAETNDESLSVVLEESLSSTLANTEDVDNSVMSAEAKEQKTSLDEAEEEDTTSLPEETVHVVIKKVLDEREIFADVTGESTVEPLVGVLDTEASLGVVVEEPQPTIIGEEAPENELEEKNKEHAIERKNEANQDDVIERQQEQEAEAKLLNPDTQEDAENHDEPTVLLSKQFVADNEENEDENESKFITIEANAEEPKASDMNAQNVEDDIVFSTSEDETAKSNIGSPESQSSKIQPSTTESAYALAPAINNEQRQEVSSSSSSSSSDFHFFSSTEAAGRDIVAEIPNADMDHTKTFKGSRSVNRALIEDDSAATLFEAYPPHDSDQTFNGNLADESAGIGKALPVTNNDGPNRSTIIIILSSGTACLFIVVSVTIFLISFQRQHGTLDIEMQERSCGKDNLDEEDAETFAKLLEVELPPSVAVALEETEECL